MTAATSSSLLVLLALTAQVQPVQPAPMVQTTPSASSGREPDELLLQQLAIGTDAQSLLTFARMRTDPTPRLDVIRAAIETVLKGNAPERAAAHLTLLAAGPPALPLLRRAAREHEDPSGQPLRDITLALERDSSSYTAAVVRLIVKRAPEGAAEVLLGLIAGAEDESILSELRNGLGALARRNPANASVLRKALADPLALRRGLTIEALARALPNEAVASLKPFLNDPVPLVRLRAALALAPTQEEGIAKLITLLNDLPPDLALEAEEYLMGLAQEQAPRMALAEKPNERAVVRDAWQTWWDATTGPALIQELRNRTLLEDDRLQAIKLIAMLGNDDFDVREKATLDLKAMGPRIRPQLAMAAKTDDLEVSARIKMLMDGLAKENTTPLPSGLPRALVLRRPPGTVEAILAYLPFVEEPGVIEELTGTLEALARVQPTSRRTLLATLQDPTSLRRQVALDALGRQPDLESLDPLKERLEDRDPSVRLRAALALVRQRERTAVPVLLDLIEKVTSSEDDRLLDDFLSRLSEGLTRPTVPEGSTEAIRKKRQAEWVQWWKDNDSQVALPRYDEEANQELVRNSGLTLVILNASGSVVAYDNEFRTRWTLAKLSSPFDAQVLPGERVLVAEHDLRRVTERNLQGDILWEKKVLGNPLQVERLPTGNTFIVCRDRLLEVTRTGREVTSIVRPVGDIYSARKLRDGSIACLSNQGRYFRVDARGKELSTFRIVNGLAHLGNDILPGGGALIPISWQNKITEYDREGKVVKEHTFAQPASVQRLSTGGLLLVNQQWPPRLVELDRTGQVVRETGLPTNPIRAVRR